MTLATSPAHDYATDPKRTVLGAHTILRGTIGWALDGAALASQLKGDAPNAQPDQHLLEIIKLRLLEAQVLAARL